MEHIDHTAHLNENELITKEKILSDNSGNRKRTKVVCTIG